MSLHRSLRTFVAALILAMSLIPVAAATAGAGPLGRGASQMLVFASAFGTAAKSADSLASGRTGYVNVGTCGSFDAPMHRTGDVAGVQAPLLTSGAIATTASSLQNATRRGGRATASISEVDVLDGLVTASAVNAVSASFSGAAGMGTSAAGSSLADLVVAGVPISGTPEPNTELALPGVGSVVLNEQTVRKTPSGVSLTVNMIHVKVTLPNPIAPVGTEIVVGNATTAVDSAAMGTAAAWAYGTWLTFADTVTSERSAFTSVGCPGSDGAVSANGVAGISLPPALVAGTIATTAMGLVTDASSTSEASSTVETVNVGDGIVTADVVTSKASATHDGANGAHSDDGSQFVNLRVLGEAIGDDVGQNTKIELAGIGTLWLRRVIETPTSIEVRMIELIVGEAGAPGLPPLSEVRVAVANASAQHAGQGGLLTR